MAAPEARHVAPEHGVQPRASDLDSQLLMSAVVVSRAHLAVVVCPLIQGNCSASILSIGAGTSD